MRFRRGCPEADAVLQKKKFAVGGSFVGTFEAKITGPNGTLKPLGSFSIDAEDLKTAQLSAYRMVSDTEAETVQVVQALSGSGQITVQPGNRYEASSDLVGSTVKVLCEYTNVVSLTDENIETLTAHVVIMDNDVFYYWKIRNSQIQQVSDRLLWLEFDPDDVVKVPIPVEAM